MARWVTHTIIADRVLEAFPQLDKKGFCVGNIGPDCNDWNEDRTDFIPSRKVTHWMSADRKKPSDTDGFYNEYFINHLNDYNSKEFYSYLLGYYCHLITDAYFQWFIREDKRVQAAWKRIKEDERYQVKTIGVDETWDNFKLIVTSQEINRERDALEAEYLHNHPDYECSYFTEILPLKEFPDYIEYLPKGSTVRKIQTMRYSPVLDEQLNPMGFSREEFDFLLNYITQAVIDTFKYYNLLNDRRLA